MPVLATKEDLNLNRIVSKQFDRAAQYLKINAALLNQIKACNNVYYFQFPVRFGGDHYEIFEGWRAEHSQHKKPVKGGTRYSEMVGSTFHIRGLPSYIPCPHFHSVSRSCCNVGRSTQTTCHGGVHSVSD